MRLRKLRVRLARRRHEAWRWAEFRINRWFAAPLAGVVIDGDIGRLPRNICIFAASSDRQSVLASVQSLLRAIKGADYGLLVVMNGPGMERHSFGGFLDERDVVISRPNRGRDFAAYQLATNMLLERGVKLDRLLYCTKIFSRFAQSEVAWTGITESHEVSYHISSWGFQLSREIVQSHAFVDFWKNYLPVNSRIHAINKGEIGLSKALLAAGFRPAVMFTANRLLRKLMERQAADSSDRLVDALSAFSLRRSPEEPLTWLFYGEERNQTHWLGLQFLHELAYPFLKKDVVYRRTYPMSLAVMLLEDFMTGVGPETLHELRARGSPSQLSSRQKLLFDAGVI